MPGFNFSPPEIRSVIAFIHAREAEAKAHPGGRRGVSPEDLKTGNVQAGKQYFEGAGGCTKCHSASGDTFSGEIAKFSPALLAGLRERGIELKSGHAENSGLHGVLRHPDGSYEGAADSRREGVARMLPAPR